MGLFWRTGQSFIAGELWQQGLKGASHMRYTIRKQGQGSLVLSSHSRLHSPGSQPSKFTLSHTHISGGSRPHQLIHDHHKLKGGLMFSRGIFTALKQYTTWHTNQLSALKYTRNNSWEGFHFRVVQMSGVLLQQGSEWGRKGQRVVPV